VHNLKKQNIEAHFTIVGEGERAEEIRNYVEKYDLSDRVTMLPFTTPEGVREYMDKADIYVFGSDFHEGWGAVVNEAMNSACSLLVSHAVGSSAHLIEYGKNGFIYEYGNINDLTEKLKTLVNDADLRHKVGVSAYQTLQEQWNAKTAVSRFLELCKDLNADKWKEGPCSKAEILKNNWIKNI
jgi:glycosyltransferase involved in cell wall biosynthesis